jgi:hypothetical protein
MDANTRYAGGTGPGSSVARSGSIMLQGDPLTYGGPNPVITPSAPTVNILPPSDNPGGYVWISGTQYPTAGTIFEIPDGALTINNMYFINKTAGNPRTAFYTSLKIGGAETYYSSVGDDSGNHLYRNVNESGVNLTVSGLAPPGSGSTTNPYGETYKNIAWRHTGPTGPDSPVAISNIYLKASVANAVGASTTLNPYNIPNVNTPAGVGSAYVRPTIDEANIPKNQGPTTNVSVSSMTRMFNSNTITPGTPNISNLTVPSKLTSTFTPSVDAVFNPSTNLIGTNSFTRYLTLRFSISTALRTFTLLLGTGGNLQLNAIFMKWIQSSYESGWLNADIDAASGGCQNGSGDPNDQLNGIYNIYSPDDVLGSHTVYITIQYNGEINFRSINVT